MRYIAITFILVSFISCDKWDDYYKDQDKAPEIIFYKNDVPYNDTIDSLKLNTSLALSYKIIHRENLNLTISNAIDSIATLNGKILTIKGLFEGNFNIDLKVVDSYNKSLEKQLTFHIFKNLLPVANFNCTQIMTLSQYETKIDASSSYDKDSRFGGKIVLYEYTFDNAVTFQTELNVVYFTFNSKGNKEVKLRVKDNDDAWSDYATKYITIE